MMKCAADDVTGGTTLSTQEINGIVKRLVKNQKVKVLYYVLVPYSEKKLGFIGRYEKLNITIKYNKRSRTKKLSLFVKSIPKSKRLEKDGKSSEVRCLFRNESIFFSKIVPILTENYTGEKWLPTCYFNENDVIVMEDLCQKNFKLRKKSFDDTQMLESALAALARFHACSILAESDSDEVSKLSTNLSTCFTKNCQQIGFSFVNDERNKWFISGVQTTLKLAEHLGYSTKNLKETFERACEAVQPSQKHRNGIIHGDVWWNNLMFAGSKKKNLKKCVIVDYQTYRYAPLALDLLQILHCTTSVAFRKEKEKDMVELYHSVLEETVKTDDKKKCVTTPTLDDVSFALSDLRVYGAAVACLYHPTVLIDLKHEDKNFMFMDRTAKVLRNMEKSQFLKQKIDESIGEMVRIGEELQQRSA